MVFCVILDGHAAELATVQMLLPATTLLGRDLPSLERNILKNFAHADDARSKRRGRQLKSGNQNEGSARMCKESKAPAESTTGGQGGAPAKP